MREQDNKQDISILWQGRTDAEDGRSGYRWHQQVECLNGSTFDQAIAQAPGIALIGFPCDMGVRNNKGRVGAAEGPDAIRTAMANLAWHGHLPLYDLGNTEVTDDLVSSQANYSDTLHQALQHKHFAIGLGGGHEIGWASFQGVRKWADQQSKDLKVGILNFDAHFDLRKPAPHTSSGTPFRQVADYAEDNGQSFHYACLGIAEASNTQALFQFANEQGVRYLLDKDCHQEVTQALLEAFIQEIDVLYVTLCLDALPASVAPGVSAPSPLGIPLQYVIDTLSTTSMLCKKKNTHWCMADIAELNPAYDRDNQTSKVAARLAFEIAALQS